MPAAAGGGTLHNVKTSRQARETFPDQPRRQFGLERISGRDLVLPQRFLDDAGREPTAAARPTPPPQPTAAHPPPPTASKPAPAPACGRPGLSPCRQNGRA